MPDLPSGTVTFLFTDIEGSTQLWERDRTAMASTMERHVSLLRAAVEAHGGVLFKVVGDAVQVAFPSAPSAVAAALSTQQALLAEDCGPIGPLRVRMALHAGEAQPDDRGDYLAAPLNRLSRLIAVGHGGQVLLSQSVQQLTRGALPAGTKLRDLGEHRLRDLLEPEWVFQLLHPDLPAEFPPLKSLDNRPNNLPLQPTPFLGREREVAAVAELLRQQSVRLVTLTGPGGIGKTRLALQTAAELLDDFPDGVFFVDLAPLTDPSVVASVIAAALGLRLEGGRPAEEVLRAFLRNTQLLLVLDNFEHLLAAAPLVGELLATPGLKVLATSRAPLHLRAEHEMPVLPLALPDLTRHESAQILSQNEAVRLFTARATAVQPDFTMDDTTAPAVAKICARLDGLPLAIELAAARVKLLPPPALLARLERRLHVLTSGPRDAPARQRTLRDAIAWSHDLLTPEQQIVFRRLAIFAGGCTFASAEAVANLDGACDLFEAIAALVDASQLRQSTGSNAEPRFWMLETVREYAAEQLAASGEETEIRQRHAAHFVAQVAQAAVGIRGPAQIQWLDHVEADLDNIRAVFVWLLEHAEPDVTAQLAVGMGEYWWQRGDIGECRSWLERVLENAERLPQTLRHRTLVFAGALAHMQGDRQHAIRRGQEALALARDHGSRADVIKALHVLAMWTVVNGDVNRAAALIEEAVDLQGQATGAAPDPMLLITLGVVEHRRGRLDHAAIALEEALAVSQTTGDRQLVADTLDYLGDVECDRGNLPAGLLRYGEALSLWRELKDGWGTADALVGFADVAAMREQWESAARFLGAADALYETAGVAVPPHDRPHYDRAVAAMRAALGDAAFASSRMASRRAGVEEVIGEAATMAEEWARDSDETTDADHLPQG
jgi:predicted ATPase/class 3 adenylate cyclase